jgi:glycosyltransferase involved in cell wall biosynthesis
MADRPLNIAYLCDITPLNPNLYSGGNARMYQALQKHVGDVTILSNSWHLAEPLRRLMHAMPEAVNLRARWRLHLALGALIGRGVRAEVLRGDYDAVFCAYSIQSLAGVGQIPGVVTAFASDATQSVYRQSEVGQSFGSYLSVSRLLDGWVERREKRILERLDLMLWPTEWMRDGATQLYGLNGDAMHVVPWGANIGDVAAPVAPAPLTRDAPIELLFMGRDWFAKGGPLARDVTMLLRAKGFDARLTVIGCTPPEDHVMDAMRIIPQLDKSKPEDMAQFEALFCGSHFLINPSFESFGFAYCEASAYGLPSLAFRVGGVPVRDGVNGHALPLGSEASAFAGLVETYVEDPGRYAGLRKSARTEYETRLNWDAWGQGVSKRIRAAIERP